MTYELIYLFRTVDTTYIKLISNYSSSCPYLFGTAKLGNNSADVPFSSAVDIVIQNNGLHEWQYSDGVLGLGYNSDPNATSGSTAFQLLLEQPLVTQDNSGKLQYRTSVIT